MVDQITIGASDPRIVYNTPTSTGTNDSDTKAWELQAWSIDGRTGVFASTSAPNAFLSLVRAPNLTLLRVLMQCPCNL